MASSFILKTIFPIGGALYLENAFLRKSLSELYESSLVANWLPKAYGAVILSSAVSSTIVLLILGFKVSAARAAAKEKALKDGDVDAEARFSYPKLYAEGFSAEAKKFNCVQRSHQQALETYTQFVALSLIGGIKFPLTATAGALVWCFGRLKWAEGYSTGEATSRYSHWASYGIWFGLLTELLCASATAVSFFVKF